MAYHGDLSGSCGFSAGDNFKCDTCKVVVCYCNGNGEDESCNDCSCKREDLLEAASELVAVQTETQRAQADFAAGRYAPPVFRTQRDQYVLAYTLCERAASWAR